jgi:EAL domain-containing protein (putative c-di-GMP-specific phosphodiesterase class I)
MRTRELVPAQPARRVGNGSGTILAVPPLDEGSATNEAIERILAAVRTHLGMDVAFVAEFAGGHRVFRYVDSALDPGLAHVGGSDPLEESYCQRVVDGRLPQLIHDATEIPAAMQLPITAALPVGAHLSVPLILSDGRLYGTLCAFSREADHSLTQQDVALLRMISEIVSGYLEADLQEVRRRQVTEHRIASALTVEGCITTLYQPIIEFSNGQVLGVEALSRFPHGRTPDCWFADAVSIGRGAELEIRALRLALGSLADLPGDVFLAVNLSPGIVFMELLHEALAGVDLERVVLEMTEHAPVDDYDGLAAALEPLRQRGLRIAVDDAGSGYASLRHILWLTPDWIKFDHSITRDIDTDSSRVALATALVEFASKVGAQVIAEGVETEAELHTLRSLGATAGQGYHLGRPSDLTTALHPRRKAVAELISQAAANAR